jgi:hypothetical protein
MLLLFALLGVGVFLLFVCSFCFLFLFFVYYLSVQELYNSYAAFICIKRAHRMPLAFPVVAFVEQRTFFLDIAAEFN